MEWLAGKFSHSYGQFKLQRENKLAHRCSYEHFVGEIPEGLVVMHRCDNPVCVRPDHLSVGTHAENAQDMVQKGRSLKGDKSPARLYPETRARGAKNGANTRPDRRPYGDRNGSRVHPERLAYGDANPSRLYPERRPKGETHSATSLTNEDVIRIRAMFRNKEARISELAQMFGLSVSGMKKIVYRMSWKHLP